MNRFKKDNKKQLSIFVTAGYPTRDSLVSQLRFLQAKQIDFIEVGIPFSDPMADGPTIQETSEIALKNGMNVELLLQQLESCSSEITTPLVLMGYLNPVLQFGLEAFLKRCADLNIASLILPDLSLEMYERKYKALFEKHKVPLTFLVTPNTPNERVLQIAETCKNSFVYLVGQNGTTGMTLNVSANQTIRYSEMKQLCGNTPLFMGFGITNKTQKDAAFAVCDGAIIGTAYLKALAKNETEQFIHSLN